MLRLWAVLLAAVLCFYARDAYGRNETIHACELVIKCFQDADVELMRCQNILSLDSPLISNAPSEPASNETTTPEPTTVAAPAASDDCMAAVKQKMQQKRALVEQRAQAFALCLNERMDRGPEDVDPRKFRYCNTVISRYNARTTIGTPPEFTLVTTPASTDTPAPPSQRRTLSTSVTVTTTSKKGTQATASAGSSTGSTGSTSRLSSSSTTTTTRSGSASQRTPLPNVRPRRQAPDVFAAAAVSNGSNGDIIRPPSATPPVRRPTGTTIGTTIGTEASTVTIAATTTDPFDVTPTAAATSPKPDAIQQVLPENEAGRIGAVARFSSNGISSTATKDGERGLAVDRANPVARNGTSTPKPAAPLDAQATSQQPLASPESGANQTTATGSPLPDLSSPSPSASSPNPPIVPKGASPPGVAPPGVSPPVFNERIAASTPTGQTIQPSTLSTILANGTSLDASSRNGTADASPVLVQQQEQAEVNVVQSGPLDQPLVDVSSLDLNPIAPPAPPATAPVPSAPSTSTTTTTTQSTTTTTTTGPAAGASVANTVGAATADEKQRNRVETLRESRRRVSEFKACMARARIKREECKPVVNCCPDSVKCHLRYELSELHDQIHRLELEISEGRQACLEKKKVDDHLVDALDQIDEEDLISDESIVSQQVF